MHSQQCFEHFKNLIEKWIEDVWNKATYICQLQQKTGEKGKKTISLFQFLSTTKMLTNINSTSSLKAPKSLFERERERTQSLQTLKNLLNLFNQVDFVLEIALPPLKAKV